MNLNNKEKNLSYNLLILLISLTNSIIGLLISSIRMIQRNDNALIFAITAAITLSFFIPPNDYDLARHYASYKLYTETNILPELNDKLLSILFYICNKLNLPQYFISLFSSFILYYLIAKIFIDLQLPSKYRLLFFLIIVTILPFLIFSGIRFSTGFAIFIYSCLYVKNKYIKTMLFLLSILCHFSITIAIVIYSTAIISIKYIHNNTWILLAIISILIGIFINQFIDIIVDFFDLINSQLQTNIFNSKSYLTEGKALNAYTDLNQNGTIAIIIKKSISYIILLLYIILFKNSKLLTTKIGLYFALSSLLFINITVFFDRFIPITYFYLIYSCANSVQEKKFNNLMLLLIFTLFIENIFSRTLELRINSDYIYNSYFSSKYYASFLLRLFI